MSTRRREAGVALIISLAFIVMLTVVVVCLLESMRTDRPAAGEYGERARAAQFAQSGVEQVVGTLQQLTADTNRNWISQPGQLVVGAPSDNTGTTVDERKVLQFSVPLSSGSTGALPPGGSAGNPFYTSPNLNVPTLRDPTAYLIAETPAGGSTPVKMQVDWIYVKQDGTLSRTLQPDNAANPTAYQWANNPDYASDTSLVVGRYAYWADDESSKINYNIAWGRDAASVTARVPTGSPGKIDLTALPGMTSSLADAFHNYISNNNSTTAAYRFLNTPTDARRLDAQPGLSGVSGVLQNSKFEVTHYSHDPNTTFFNEPRIVLTTHPASAGWTYNTNPKYPGQWVGINNKNWADGGQPRYIRILVDNPSGGGNPETGDPGGGYNTSIDNAKLYDTVAMLAYRSASTGVSPGYLERQDWPMVNGNGSFQSKYYSTYPTTQSASKITAQTSRLGEMAINIIEYVRAKESNQAVIQPIRGYFDALQTDPTQVFIYAPNGAAFNGYVGLTRCPAITEMGCWYGQNTTGAAINPPYYTPLPTPDAPTIPIQPNEMYFVIQVELYLPQNYGLDKVDLSSMYLDIGGFSPGSVWDPNYGPHNASVPIKNYNADCRRIQASEVSTGSTILQAGQYAVVTRQVRSQLKSTDPRPTFTGAGTAVLLEGGILNTNYQICPANGGLINGMPIDANPSLTPVQITSLETDDPRLNSHPNDWVAGTGNTFGKVNARYSAGKAPSGALASASPEIDIDGANVSDASLVMPAPRGKTFTRGDGTVDDNSATGSNGLVTSVGELGYIHTGIEPCSFFSLTNSASNKTATIPAGTGWRTLRLQPNSFPDTKTVPDWALMDLFTAPITPPLPTASNMYVYAPHANGFGGRINLNSQAQPFGLSRTLPLAAVLQNCTFGTGAPNAQLPAATALTYANNIYNRKLAAKGKFYGYQSGYCSPGEVVEIAGIADGGEKSEELVRQISNIVTNRGDVFSVYTIGQAIKQGPNNTFIVTGEQRLQAMVERYYNYSSPTNPAADTSGDPTKNEIRFAPVYYRNLTP